MLQFCIAVRRSSFCQLGVTLESGVPLILNLEFGDCMPHFTPWRHEEGAEGTEVSSV